MKTAAQFEFIAGCLALDYVDTFGGRAGEGRERLANPPALAAWVMHARLLPSLVDFSPAELAIARTLREGIYRCAVAVIDGSALPMDDVELLNASASKMPLRPRLQQGEIVRGGEHPLEAVLSVLAEDALGLLTLPRRERLRRCPECAMLFEDTSRPGKRRWCSSASGCGNRAKVRAHRARRDTET